MWILRSKESGYYVTSYFYSGGLICWRFYSQGQSKAKVFTTKQLRYWETHGNASALAILERIWIK